MRVPSDEEKKAVWEAYHQRRPTRVPLTWGVNCRIILLDPALNPEGYTFEEYFHEPPVTLRVQARFQEYCATVLSKTCDLPSALPERWHFYVDNQNVYDAAYFGAPVVFEEGQVPAAKAIYSIDDIDDFLRRDFSQPLANSWLRQRLEFHAALKREAERFTYLGRQGEVAPLGLGFDGAVTALASLFGSDGFLLLKAEPEKARQALMKIASDCLTRNRALAEMSGGWKKSEHGGLVDDSIQLIGVDTYRDVVLAVHAFWYEATSDTRPADKKRGIHLCGDASRHFLTLRDELGVYSFDTGFPVDHGGLRRLLGPEVEILGGPHVALLLNGSPAECAAETDRILRSGVKEGGRFILREGNNLPPQTPLANLAAVYETCLAEGRYSSREAVNGK
ncbi:MAG: hypothetical protein N3A66_01070 [Planctomycetota bacterium]|nr:hypothetical protein [Planctomycetota bacterium]